MQYEKFMNETEFADEITKEIEENSSSQTESNTILNIDEKITKLILETLHGQRKKWRPHNGNVLCWFSMSLITKKLQTEYPKSKSCIVPYVIPN